MTKIYRAHFLVDDVLISQWRHGTKLVSDWCFADCETVKFETIHLRPTQHGAITTEHDY